MAREGRISRENGPPTGRDDVRAEGPAAGYIHEQAEHVGDVERALASPPSTSPPRLAAGEEERAAAAWRTTAASYRTQAAEVFINPEHASSTDLQRRLERAELLLHAARADAAALAIDEGRYETALPGEASRVPAAGLQELRAGPYVTDANAVCDLCIVVDERPELAELAAQRDALRGAVDAEYIGAFNGQQYQTRVEQVEAHRAAMATIRGVRRDRSLSNAEKARRVDALEARLIPDRFVVGDEMVMRLR